MDEKRRDPNLVVGRVETRAVPARELRPDARAAAAPRAQRSSLAGRNPVAEDFVGVTDMDAVGSATDRPPAPTTALSTESDRIRRLVDELSVATPGAEGPSVQALLRFGEPAVRELVRAFPGAVWFNRHETATRLPKGRGVSGVAAALVEFGALAVPHVEGLLRDRDADTRHLALLVLAELGTPQLPERAAPLVVDPDSGVSNIAILTIQAHRNLPSRALAMEQLYHYVNVPNPPIAALLRTFFVLRDPGCVPHIADVLQHTDAKLVEATERVLRALTGRDLGAKPARWLAWYQRHAHLSRTEWLLSAASSWRVKERTLAAEELQLLSGETFGFAPDGGWLARRRAVAAYRAHFARQSETPD
jgi:hypothetical protein